MKVLFKIVNVVVIMVILVTIIASISSAVTKKPILFSVIRSNSMYPVWERGDMVIIENTSSKDEIQIGDIIFFKAEEGNLSGQGWIAHRVMNGNESKGFITKGDANAESDQVKDGILIQRDWVAGRAMTIGDTPIVIPKLGYLSLWMEKYQGNPYILPGFALVLALIIGVGELKNSKKNKNRKKKGSIELPLIYFLGGITISVVIAATMITSYQRINVHYEVSNQQGIIMGSSIGILKEGEQIEKPLSTFSNNGIIKLIGVITTDDTQITVSHPKVSLVKGEQKEVTFTVHANKQDKYESTIHMGLFYPLLPSSVIYFLAQKSFWLALFVISLIPGLPMMMYPIFDRKFRNGVAKTYRRNKGKLLAKLPF